MKKLIFGILFPVILLCTIITSVCAIWYFNDGASNNVNTNVNVTSYATVGTLESLTPSQDIFISFDQSTETYVDNTKSGVKLLKPIVCKFIPPTDPNIDPNTKYSFKVEIIANRDYSRVIAMNPKHQYNGFKSYDGSSMYTITKEIICTKKDGPQILEIPVDIMAYNKYFTLPTNSTEYNNIFGYRFSEQGFSAIDVTFRATIV